MSVQIPPEAIQAINARLGNSLPAQAKASLMDFGTEEEVVRDPPMYLKKGGRRMNEQELDDLGKEIWTLITDGRRARQTRDMRVAEWRRRWDMIPRRRRSGPWKNSANYHSPLTRYTGETISSRCKRIVTGADPYIRIRPARPEDGKTARDMENFIQSELTEDIDFEDLMDTAIDMGCQDGFVVLQPYWQYEIRKERDKKLLDTDLLARLGYKYRKNAMFVEGTPVNLSGKTYSYGSRIDVEEEVVTKNCIGVRIIDYMDFVIYPATARTIKSAALVGQRMHVSLDTLRHWAKDGMIDDKALERLESRNPSVVSMGNQEQNGDPWEDMIEGIGHETGDSIKKHGLLEVYEVCYRHDHDNDGLKEDCLFRIEMSTRTILSAQPWPYWMRERNYIPIVPFKRRKRLYGYAMGEILNDLQLQDNVTMNQSVDVATLNLMPIIKEKKTARTKWASRTLELGKVQIVDEMDEFQIEHFNLPTQQVVADRARILDMAERLSAAAESAQGVPTHGTNTLGEVEMAAQGGAIRLDVIAGRIQRAVTQLGRWIIALNRQFLDEVTEFALTRRTGRRVFGEITKEQLRSRVFVKAHGNSLNTDKNVDYQRAEKVKLASERSPFVMADLRKMYRVEEAYYQAMGIEEPEFFIGTYEEAEAMQQRLEQTKAQEAEWPALSGRLDEIATLAVLLSQHPEMEESIEKVVMMQKRADIAFAAQEAMVDSVRLATMGQQRLGSGGGGTRGGRSFPRGPGGRSNPKKKPSGRSAVS